LRITLLCKYVQVFTVAWQFCLKDHRMMWPGRIPL
jgi:hypothetical protein